MPCEKTKKGFTGVCKQHALLSTGRLGAVVIPTFVAHCGRLWFQTGSGGVAKGDEEHEWEESNNKLGALVKATQGTEEI